MSHESLLSWKEAAKSSLEQTDLNSDQEADTVWSLVSSHGQCFNYKQRALRYLDTLDSPQPLVKTFAAFRENPRKVSVRLYGADSKMPADSSTSNAAESKTLVITSLGSAAKALVSKKNGYWP